MKKSLIALAVLASSGASFAQVSLTGNLAMGYLMTSTGAAANVGGAKDASGFGVDTSQINFAAVEDLGGGMKMTAKMALMGADRGGASDTGVSVGAVTGGDASLTLATSVGSFVLATARGTDYLTAGTAGVGAYYSNFGLDGRLFSARSNRDTASYTLPIGAITLGFSYQENAAGLGLGAGVQGSDASVGQGRNIISAKYAQGPLVVDGAFLSYNNSNLAGRQKDATRLSASYDLGSMKLGLGTEIATFNSLGRRADYLFGMSVPMGALTFGTQIAMRDQDTAGATASGAQTLASAPGAVAGLTRGTSLYVNYALSKRTNIIGNYAAWTRNKGDGGSNLLGGLLSHSF